MGDYQPSLGTIVEFHRNSTTAQVLRDGHKQLEEISLEKLRAIPLVDPPSNINQIVQIKQHSDLFDLFLKSGAVEEQQRENGSNRRSVKYSQFQSATLRLLLHMLNQDVKTTNQQEKDEDNNNNNKKQSVWEFIVDGGYLVGLLELALGFTQISTDLNVGDLMVYYSSIPF